MSKTRRQEKPTPTDRWVIAGVLISLVIGAGSLGWQVFTFLQERASNQPKLEVNYVGLLGLGRPTSSSNSSGGYAVKWFDGQFDVIVFVVSAHEYKLKVGSVEFKPSIDGEKHLLPERVHDASVMIAKDYEVYGTASGSVTLPVPVYTQLWLRPESTVFQSPIDFGTLTFDITVVDLRTNYSATQRNQTDVVWFNGLT